MQESVATHASGVKVGFESGKLFKHFIPLFNHFFDKSNIIAKVFFSSGRNEPSKCLNSLSI